jgi:hypothetical protein
LGGCLLLRYATHSGLCVRLYDMLHDGAHNCY